MERFIKNLVYYNLVISLGAASFLIFSFLVLNSEVNWYAVIFTFASTLLMYNLQRIHKLKDQKVDEVNERHLWISNNKRRLQFIVVICSLSLMILIPFFTIAELIGLGILGVLSFFYAFKTKLGSLRELPGTKIFLIAFVWSATVLIFTSESTISNVDLTLFGHNFLFILAITIPFDIRDLHFDEKHYKTIPQVFGVLASRIASSILMLISFLILVNLLGEFSFFLSLVYGIFTLLCCSAKTSRKELYFSGIMDFTLTFLMFCFLLYQNVSIFHF